MNESPWRFVVDKVIAERHLAPAIRGTVIERLDRAVSAVLVRENKIVGVERLREIAERIAVDANRDAKAGLLERVVSR
jgi:hypothetical protein